MTAIIILNWNNANDTIHCLSSLTKANGDFRVYVVDNGSTDDSLQRINEWVDSNRDIEVSVVPLEMNYGFAKGNNKGIAFARQHNPDYFLLLNNDTEVKPDFLTMIFDFKQRHPEYSVLTPKIYFFSDKKKIWNCGGRLAMGFRKYYYAGQGDDAGGQRVRLHQQQNTQDQFRKTDAQLAPIQFFHKNAPFELEWKSSDMKNYLITIAAMTSPSASQTFKV